MINLLGKVGLGKASEKRQLRINKIQLQSKMLEKVTFIQLIKNSVIFHYFSNISFEHLEKDMGLDVNNVKPLK